MMKVFFSNYHISVNPTIVSDLVAAGLEVILPSANFASGRIWFYASNDEFRGMEGVTIVDYDQWRQMEPMAIITPTQQHVEDFDRLYQERGCVDQKVYLTANSTSVACFPLDVQFVLSHDLYYHRKTTAPYKVWYFNQPTFALAPKTDEQIRRTFDERKIKLYVNNFDQEGFEPEYAAAQVFREQYLAATGVRVPFFGYGMPDGWPQPPKTHEEMRDSMLTLCFKRRETWGQMIGESMQLGTPAIFLKEFIYSTFTEYLINPDVAIVGDTVEELIARIVSLRFEDYETLVREAQWQSRMFCNDSIRVEKVKWLFGKVEDALRGRR